MEHPRRIANATRIHGHIDDLLLHRWRLTSISICEEKCASVIWARTAPIALLALPCHAMAHNIRTLTVGAVKYLKNHESILWYGSFSTSHPRSKDSRSTPLKHLLHAKAATDSSGILPLIPREGCHPFHGKAATDSTAKLPPIPHKGCHPCRKGSRRATPGKP